MRRARGLTLIELLTALAVLSLLATLGWRALDGLLRVREATEARSAAQLGWTDVMAQWQLDLDQMVVPSADLSDPTAAWSQQGGTVRLLRHAADSAGWQVVAWAAVDDGRRWARWASGPLTTREALAQAWAQAPQRVRAQGVRTVAISGAEVQVWDGMRWSVGSPEGTPPAAVRLILVPAAGAGFDGALTLDWVSARVAGGKS
ncbi:MAG: prepilin-type N-terminal cleavage/methylation domain-containing protein [Tepidimonas sp.]|uniref:PulJ/GspJ family protein n=1 Tax=Tepidimonas sp. TaxID=2002775 RepID=UPI00259FA2AA|nr:prepilin-type N-terminal cleavage/methylation domain-containing protein [Tepidimonas sp.]MDM7456561.1 prepilin-type N-terminal cleavage/methylation domain-containing protein [Tepidimonas sp.]